MNLRRFVILLACLAAGMPGLLGAYPIDGYERTGIRRLLRLGLIADGTLTGAVLPGGARRPLSSIRLNLLGDDLDAADVFLTPDAALQEKINALFPDRHESYSVAILDIAPGRPPRFAARQANSKFAVGSVGKLAIAAGLFAELKRLYPDNTTNRLALLKTRMVIADKWIADDHHQVPIYDPETRRFESRQIREGDVFSLYEWTDHMLSASANSASSTVWKELMLMRHFGHAYPPNRADEALYFTTSAKTDLGETAMHVVNDPLGDVGIPREAWQLGSFFTREGKKRVPGEGNSLASPLALLRYLVAMEQGKLVDAWSSLEIKRLLFMTAKRIRYASSPALNDAAVYFKSGSLYRCRPEPDFKCGKYQGNVENVMNSVAIVEHPDGQRYLVALMSNVLKKNSAVEHQSLATFIDRIITGRAP